MMEAKMIVVIVCVLGGLHLAFAKPICDADKALEAKAQCGIIIGIPGLANHSEPNLVEYEDGGYIESGDESNALGIDTLLQGIVNIKQDIVGLPLTATDMKGSLNIGSSVEANNTKTGYIRSEPNKKLHAGRKRRHLPEGCQELIDEPTSEDAIVKRVDISYFGAVGIIGGQKDPVTLSVVVELSGESPDVHGQGLWKLSMYGSKHTNGTGEQFQRVDQLLSNRQQAMPFVDGEFINFGFIHSSIDVSEIGCHQNFRYVCFDFMKGEYATPDFSFVSSQLDNLNKPSSKWTKCEDRCKQIEDTTVVLGLSAELNFRGFTEGQKSPFTLNITAMFAQFSDDVRGTGLWKLSIYGSKNADGTGQKFQPIDQLLSNAQQAHPLLSGENNMNFFVTGELEITAIGCGITFRYVCYDFTKGENPSEDFTFMGGKDAQSLSTKFTLCSDQCPPSEDGLVRLDQMKFALDIANRTEGEKDSFSINMTVLFTKTSADIVGTGLWKLSMYGSKRLDGTGEHLHRTNQILSPIQQVQPLINSDNIMFKELVFIDVKAELDILSIGCDEEFKYLCFEFTKGDKPSIEFDLMTFQEDRTRFLFCQHRCPQIEGFAVARLLAVSWGVRGAKQNQKDQLNMNATIGFSEATDFISGTGLWKLSVYGSTNENGTGEHFQRDDRLLTSEHQSQPLDESTREEMVFYDVQGELDILAIGCGKKFRYVCFDFTKGDNPEPWFNFTALRKDRSKITVCSDRCKQAKGLNVENGFILVTDLAGGIKAAPLDSDSGVFSFQDIPAVAFAPAAIDFDPVHQKIYFTDVRTSTIDRCNLDGKLQEIVLHLTAEATPDGLAIAPNQRIMYWTDATLQTIEKSDLNGNNRQVILNSPKPRAIVVDPNNEWLYWTDWGSQPKIEKANTDGTNRRTLIDSDLQWPNGLAVEFSAERMYWCDAGTNKIESADLDGRNRRTHLSTGLTLDIHPYDIGIYQGNIMWTDWAFKQVLQIGTAENSQPGLIGDSEFRRASGLHIQLGTRRGRRDVSLKGPFSNCHDVIDPVEFFNDCTRNWCSAQSYMQFCDDITAYAEACESQGVFIGEWRDSIGCDL